MEANQIEIMAATEVTKNAPFALQPENVYAAITYFGERVELKISSHAVCLASPIWRAALLFPTMDVGDQPSESEGSSARNYKESLSNLDKSTQEITLRGDNRESASPLSPPGEEEEVEEQNPASDEVSMEGQLGQKEQECVPGPSERSYKPLGEDDLVDDKLNFTTSGNHSQNCRGPRKILDLTEDNAQAVLLLLRIVHLKFDDIPTSLSFDELHEVAVACDYYKCHRLVLPWIPFWLDGEEESSKKSGQEKWLFIAWVFGRQKVFEELAAKLVREIRTNEKGDCLLANGEILSIPLPLGIVDSILSVRFAAIDTLFEIPYGHIDRFTSNWENHYKHSANFFDDSNSERAYEYICQQSDDPQACDSTVYGSLVTGLGRIGLWPRKSPGEVHISLNDLASLLQQVRIISMPRGRYYDSYHAHCAIPAYKEEIATALASIRDPVLDSHRQHMKDQNDIKGSSRLVVKGELGAGKKQKKQKKKGLRTY